MRAFSGTAVIGFPQKMRPGVAAARLGSNPIGGYFSRRLSVVLAVTVLPVCGAAAQTLPWPTDPPRAAGSAMAPAPAMIPGSVAPPGPMPMAPMATPAVGAAPYGAPSPFPQAGFPQAGGPAGGGPSSAPPPCLAEFLKLREDVEKKGKAAKAASEHKATREEMCKQITVYSAAELKWVKFAESHVATCGIPANVATELKTVHTHTEDTKSKICAATAAIGVAAAPSLADALGTTRLPTPETTRTGSGTLDTLTGNAIQR
jgi:hypothetical protein